MLASSGERMPPCGVPVLVSLVDAVLGEDPGLEERLHQCQDAFVSDPSSDPAHQGGVVDGVEARLDVRVQHPLVARGCRGGGSRRSRPAPAASGGTRSETGMKSASKIGSSTSFKRRLNDPVRDRRDAQPAELPAPPWGSSVSRTGSGRNRAGLQTAHAGRSRTAPTLDVGRRWRPGATPSTPAVRAPLLPRTRSHATTRNAGSCTRLNRSSNRRPGSSTAHWCSLVCILVPARSAASRSGHGVTGVHQRPPSHAVPSLLRTRWSPSPCDRLSRPRTTTGPPPHPAAISRRRTFPPPAWLAGRGGDHRDGSHVHCLIRSTG